MSRNTIAKRRDALELIGRLLNKTTLTTQQVSHANIIGLGDDLMKKTVVDIDGEKRKAVEEALEGAEKRHTRELRAALRRQEDKLTDDKSRALEKQKQHYEILAKRVAEQRDRAEQERARELRRKFDKELEDALKAQFEECERLKEEAIEAACTALRKKLRDEFAWEKEQAIGEALARAREKFKIREEQTILRTKKQCKEEFDKVLEGVQQEHAEEMRKQHRKYDILRNKYNREMAHKARVEADFKGLQSDYRRFMDYTDGQYHSDYMMLLRNHGHQIAAKRVSVVTYEDIEEL